jgi:cytochrome c-type biogenesis protein CcmH/NrfG
LQEYERAAEAYQEAIRLDESGMYPPSEHPYIDYALMLERQGGATGGRSMQDRVLGLLKTGLARNPQSARANFELGRVFFKSARYHEAEE